MVLYTTSTECSGKQTPPERCEAIERVFAFDIGLEEAIDEAYENRYGKIDDECFNHPPCLRKASFFFCFAYVNGFKFLLTSNNRNHY